MSFEGRCFSQLLTIDYHVVVKMEFIISIYRYLKCLWFDINCKGKSVCGPDDWNGIKIYAQEQRLECL